MKKYYLDNSVEKLIQIERQKYKSSQSGVLDIITTGALCSMGIVMVFYLSKMILHLPEALNSF